MIFLHGLLPPQTSVTPLEAGAVVRLFQQSFVHQIEPPVRAKIIVAKKRTKQVSCCSKCQYESGWPKVEIAAGATASNGGLNLVTATGGERARATRGGTGGRWRRFKSLRLVVHPGELRIDDGVVMQPKNVPQLAKVTARSTFRSNTACCTFLEREFTRASPPILLGDVRATT